ncbi:THAP domain-containing protein 3 isoform X2 [Chelonia mydas]|uniref:THAP domain-containing protein 3 isoform X2 n=1 Tax=Chelonia mydas TaxID=8469 RepID=UPI001CA8347D|nr:THAP domain-containing protein 3 isoform X2 [Chelonia mydas]
MPKSCAALRCSNRYSSRRRQQLTFHRFPLSRPELLARWVGNIGRGNFQPSSHTVLCSQHFQPDCFSAFGNRTNLKPNAVPTLFAFPRTVRDFTRTEDGRRLDVETVLHQEPQPSTTEEPIEELSERLSQTTRETDCVGKSAEVTTKCSQVHHVSQRRGYQPCAVTGVLQDVRDQQSTQVHVCALDILVLRCKGVWVGRGDGRTASTPIPSQPRKSSKIARQMGRGRGSGAPRGTHLEELQLPYQVSHFPLFFE